MDTIALPVTFNAGSITTITEGTDEYYAHLLVFALKTEPGEMALNPDYGTEDPTFDEDLLFQVSLSAAQYVPEVTITDIVETANEFGQASVKILFRRSA